jgi:hypothetical protein
MHHGFVQLENNIDMAVIVLPFHALFFSRVSQPEVPDFTLYQFLQQKLAEPNLLLLLFTLKHHRDSGSFRPQER